MRFPLPPGEALAEPSGAGSEAKARYPQTGDFIANVSARQGEGKQHEDFETVMYSVKRNNLFRYAGALALALLLLGPARAEDELRNPFAGDAAAAAEGKRLFLKTGCYSCHGHEAEGAVGPDLTDDEWIYKPTDLMIFNTIAKGRRDTVMAPFTDQLAPEEIWKIVEFLRDKNRQRHANDHKLNDHK